MTSQTQRISPTVRVCVLRQDVGALVLTQELRKLRGGHAWCIVSSSLLDYLPAIAQEAQA